jgi:Kef-type K+ transport system membrane component KefB
LDHFFNTLISLALALLLSLGLGRMAARIGVPRVTVYLLVGVILGPYVVQRFFHEGGLVAGLLLGPHTERVLEAVKQLAIGFILFGVGAEFRLRVFREVGPRILGLSAVEIGLTGLLVGFAVGVGTGDWRLAVIAPVLAISSAPSATLVTLREIEADGPTSRSLILCVGHNNLAALLLFPLLLAVAFGVGHPAQATGFALLALLTGGCIGFGAAVWLESITGRREFVLLGILVVFAALGLVHWIAPGSTGLGMLACFAAGIALGLVAALEHAAPAATAELRHVVVASVVVFELAGPWLVRRTALVAGEVKLANLLPVVDANDRFKDVISYEEVKNTLYDPALRDLVIAEDLTDGIEDPLKPESSLATALEIMDRHNVHSWPVGLRASACWAW